MTKKTRIILFLTCLFLFFLITPAAILYPQGYRIDLNPPTGGIKLTQTGGLFLKITPRQADIYIDEKLNKKTDFFFGSALIENLLPKKYEVEIKKEEYHSWKKALEIKEKEVTEAKNITLFPKNINLETLLGQVEEFWLFPEQRKIIVKKVSEEKTGWILELYEPEKNSEIRLFSDEESRLIDLNLSDDSKKIHLEIETDEIKYFELETEKPDSPLIEITPLPFPIEDAIVCKDDYCLDNSGNFFKNGQKLTLDPFPIKEEVEYRLEVFQDFIFLLEENDLYKFNPDLRIFEIFFENINNLKLSPDKRKLAYFSNHEIWLIFLDNIGEPFNKNRGEKLLLIRFSEKINNVFWVNDDYLILINENKIKISEIDNRDRLNIIDIFDIKNLPQNKSFSKISWSQFDKKIYLLSGENLYRSNSLLP
jgi:hypothetical protein